MAAQIEKNREIAMKRYVDDEENNSKFCTHFGTHYSTSAYVYFYLMRIEPFTSLLIRLQSYKQEVADRMFFNIDEILNIFNNGRDNRELIPEIFNNIEIFINLNCSDFGNKKNGKRIDDFSLGNKNSEKQKDSNVSDFVKFVIDNKKLLNNKKIATEMNNWIDIIFGVNQLPESDKKKKKSFNIYYRESYEQNINLNEKMKKLIDKGKETNIIISKIKSKINLMISFGQTPYQIFHENHPKFGYKQTKHNDENFEDLLSNMAWNKEIKLKIELEPIFFTINSTLGKIILLNKERKIEIVENTLYAQKQNEKF